MTFAKYTVFELIRAIRRLGAVGLFIIGLLIGSTMIATFSEDEEQSAQSRFAADASQPAQSISEAAPSQPWSRIMGGGGFEKVTDVAVTRRNELVFAGLSLGVEQDEPSKAVIVRTGLHGFVHTQIAVDDSAIGSVSRAVLDTDGAARLVHWVGRRPAFARTNPNGDVIWSRVFDVESEHVWADIQDARGDHSLVALAGSESLASDLRIIRLDEHGKLVWRSDLDPSGPVETINLFDSGDGGALIAIEALSGSGTRAISLARLDRRGRVAWERELVRGVDARLADATLESDGSMVLLAGTPSALIRFDGLGQLSWMRDLPQLSLSGRHVIASMVDGGVQVLAEPVTTGIGRRHWIARFDPDGREVWARTRANRSNVTLEAAKIASHGILIAGGSMVGSADGDTDMLMMAVANDGSFPQGFGSVPTYETRDPAMLAAINPSTTTVLAASTVVDGSRALEAAYAADSAALQTTEKPDIIRLPRSNSGPIQAPARSAMAALAAETQLNGDARPQTREVAAPVEVAAISATDFALTGTVRVPPGAGDVTSQATGTDQNLSVDPFARDRLVEDQAAGAVEAVREVVVRTVLEERPAYAYQCTFTCLADSDDTVKYPVTRMIANVAEENAKLVSLDVMAMDNGICLATGGRPFDDPRLPPLCDRVN
ncbi:MAG: hypothetical protein AAF829_11490 [Pseudomonadota bacterium]